MSARGSSNDAERSLSSAAKGGPLDVLFKGIIGCRFAVVGEDSIRQLC